MEETHPEILPAEGFTPLKSVPTTANASASLLARLRSLTGSSETPSRPKRSMPFSSVGSCLTETYVLTAKEICSVREGSRVLWNVQVLQPPGLGRKAPRSRRKLSMLHCMKRNELYLYERLCAGHDAIVVSRGRN